MKNENTKISKDERELQRYADVERERKESRTRNAQIASRLECYRQADNRDVCCSQSSQSEQENDLKEYAKENEIWLNEKDIAENSARKIPYGKEADVYLSKDGKTVTKIINYTKYSKTPLDFLDNRILLFNRLFYGTAYTIVGFTETDKGFSFVVNQLFIKGHLLDSPLITIGVEAYKKQQQRVADYFKERFGMESAGLDAYSNEEIIIQDLHFKNIMQGEDGNLYVIDAVPSLTKS